MTQPAPRGDTQVLRTGRVKWFNEISGTGVVRDLEGGEYPVHFSVIVGEGFRTLSEGEPVEFDVAGRHAARVRRLSED